MVTPDGRWRVQVVDGLIEIREYADDGEHVRLRTGHPKVAEVWLRGQGVFETLVDEDDPECE